ncbi:MAG: hypothetical protein DRI46_13920, partial [Chloroflexi bacterium]
GSDPKPDDPIDPENPIEPIDPEKPEDPEIESEISINLNEFASGKFKSIDEITNVLNSHDELSDKLTQAETAKGEMEQNLESLKATLEEAKNNNPLAKYPLFYKLAKFSEANPENSEFYQQLAMGNPDPLTILKADFIIEHPEFKDRAADVEKMVKSRYKDYLGADADNESEEYGLTKLMMEADAGSAKTRLLKNLDGIEIPKLPTEEDIKNEQKEYLKTWGEPFKKIVSEIGPIKIELPDPDDESKTVELSSIKLSGTEKDKYVKLAASIIGRGGLKHDENTIKYIKGEIRKQIIADNINEVVKNSYNNGHTDGSQGHRQRVVNSTPLKDGRKKPGAKVVDQKENVGNQLIEDSKSGKF